MKAAACALALLAVAATAAPKTLTVEKYGVALEVPEGWADSPEIARAMRPPAELIAGLAASGGKRTFTGLTASLKPNEASGYIKGLLDSLTRQGFTLGAKTPVTIHGVAFDSYTGSLAGAPAPILQIFSTFANGRAYTISVSSQIGDPTQDAELQGLVRSFRFLTPPQPFKQAADARAIGYEIGRFIGMLICPALVLLGAGALFGGGYFLLRKKK